MNIKLRKAKLSDIKTIDEFQQGIAIHERPLDPTIKRKGRVRYYHLKEFRSLIRSKHGLILIAELDREPIGCGFAQIKKSYADWSKYKYKGSVGMMFVKKKYRGKGIGKQILKQLLKWLKKNKIKDIRLQVYENNAIAVNAYKKSGFKEYLKEMVYRP